MRLAPYLEEFDRYRGFKLYEIPARRKCSRELTFRDEHVNRVRFGVGRPAGVVSAVACCCTVNYQAAVSLRTGLRAHGDSAPGRVVVDHVVIVVPEHVLRRRRTLQRRSKTHFLIPFYPLNFRQDN